ncbi:MAG: ATP-binding protein, partial [candidate division KSB1 bacterium]|nr:ATP-binding protein [candidate division KSB1 bacterium]
IIEDFLQYANPKKLKLKETDVNHLLQEILLLFRERLNSRIEQKVHLDAQLPLILIDPNQIKQVLINIIKNAMEAMPDGGVLTILTRQAKNRSGQDMVEILIKDTGCGIDPFDLKKIFQPFYSTKEKGAGMGLAICERIVQNHGGEIRVESRAGKGAVFLLALPMKLSLS